METETNEENSHPQISHEEYLELVSMRQQVVELKASKSDVQEFLMTADQYLQQLPQAREQLQTINNQINDVNSVLQNRFQEIITPLGISGEFTISDTEPHFIVSAQSPVAADYAVEAPAESEEEAAEAVA